MTRRNIAKDTAAGIIEDAIEVIYMLNYIPTFRWVCFIKLFYFRPSYICF